MICVGHDADGFLLWQCLQGAPRQIPRDKELDGGLSPPYSAAGNSKEEVGLSQNWPADCGLWAMPSREPRQKLHKERVSDHVVCTEKEKPLLRGVCKPHRIQS